MTADIIKVCSCGRGYTANSWCELPDAKKWNLAGDRLEQRLCPCGSHIVVSLPPCGCDFETSCASHSCVQCGRPLDEGGIVVGGDRYCDESCRWNGADDDERPPSDRATFREEAPFGSEV
jgi:hypothetical protein